MRLAQQQAAQQKVLMPRGAMGAGMQRLNGQQTTGQPAYPIGTTLPQFWQPGGQPFNAGANQVARAFGQQGMLQSPFGAYAQLPGLFGNAPQQLGQSFNQSPFMPQLTMPTMGYNPNAMGYNPYAGGLTATPMAFGG
jgi:hypothetical protein